MHSDSSTNYREQDSWLDCIGELINKNFIIQTEDQSFVINDDPIFMDVSSSSSLIRKTNHSSPKTSCQTSPNYMISDSQQNQTTKMTQQHIQTSYKSLKRSLNQQQQQNLSQNHHNFQEQTSKQQSSKQSQKQAKKQSQYSKSYRQRKKQQLKCLQQQNSYLKQKINQLQNRLREKQLQINRLKHPPQQNQFSVQQLNQQFLKKTNLMLSKTSIDPVEYGKTIYSPEDKFYYEFMNSYDQRGFGGRLKKNVLNYYFNQLLQSMIRDSEKYLFLVCNNCKNHQQMKGLDTYQQIDLAFEEILQMDEEKRSRIKFFTENLHPFMQELKQLCSSLCTDFNKIITFLDKVHNFMKSTYPTNMDFARKRIELENWFEFNKHSKLIRRLRSQWLEFIKKAALDQEETRNSIGKGKKKKKSSQNNTRVKC